MQQTDPQTSATTPRTDADMVNHPPHYTSHPSGVECIAITEHMSFCLGNAIKYLWRADEKGTALEDLEKARWYIDREIRRRDGCCCPGVLCSSVPEPQNNKEMTDLEELNDLCIIIMEWWEEHKYDTQGDCGSRNVYDDEPEFVTQAKKLIGDWEDGNPSF